LPLGVEADAGYEAETLVLPTRSRLVVYSDGVVEQQSPEGNEFGVDRAIETLAACGDVETDVESLVRGVIEFAHPTNPNNASGSNSRAGERTARLADDVTVASIIVG
jgi:serine phosphatase RsbU (regulator of sigma subunit)